MSDLAARVLPVVERLAWAVVGFGFGVAWASGAARGVARGLGW